MLKQFIADKGERAEGILGRFIEDRVKNYVAPGRKGVPRGELIGFSESKYKAGLLSLTSIDLNKQAEKAGVSYGFLRRWRSEDRFLTEVEKYAKEFSDLFYQRFEKGIEKEGFLNPLLLGRYEIGLQKIIETSSGSETNLFDDLELWGLITRDHVVKRLLEGARKTPGGLFLQAAIYCIEIIRKDMRFRRRLERRCILYFIREIREDIATQPEISEKDRQNEDIMLGTIESWLTKDER